MKTTTIEGKKYDITNFAKNHPGGAELIRLAEGRDSTYLFWSYHIDRKKARKILETLPCVGTDEKTYLSPDFLYTLQDKVLSYLKENKIKKRGGNLRRTMFYIFFTFLFTYFVCFCGYWYLSPILGIFLSSFGLCIQHSANHGSLFDNNLLNYIFGYFNDIMGASSFMWKTQHNIAHHAHTNNSNKDPDVYANYPIFRFSKNFEKKWYHKYQILYMPFFMGFMSNLYTVLDIVHFITGKYINVPCPKIQKKDVFYFAVLKIIHIYIYYYTPIVKFGHWWSPLIVFYTGSLYLATQFLLSHNTFEISKNNKHVDGWAEYQISESSNWKSSSKIINFMTSGLNTQIEHHLFPGISDKLYPLIYKIVRNECNKKMIEYVEYSSFFENLKSCIRYFYELNK